jgi:hypothetical protein
MKKIWINLSGLSVFLLFANMTCTKLEDAQSQVCFKVRILGYLCGQANFQILDTKYYYLGEDGWIDANNKKQDHVFKSLLTCPDLSTLDALARPDFAGLELSVTILEKQDNTACTICKALLYGPATFHYVKLQGDQCK